MAQSARAWAVAKLKALSFEGDADALGQYVDALIENNRETEAGDPALLRKQVTTDLNDFLEPPAAKNFVDALMRHLSTPDAPPAETPTEKPAPSRSAANDDRLMGALGQRTSPVEKRDRRREERERKETAERERREKQDRERQDRERNDRNQRTDRNDRPDRMERDRRDRHERPDRKDRVHRERPERLEMRIADLRDRQPRKPTIIERLGDRKEDHERRQETERAQVNPQNQSWEVWENRQRRGMPRRGDRPMDLRDRLGPARAKRPREDDAERDVKFSRRGDQREQRDLRKRGDDDMQGVTRGRGRDEEVKPPGPWPPEIMGRMPMMPPPIPFGMMPPPHMMGVPSRGGRGVFRGREGRDMGGRNNIAARGGRNNNNVAGQGGRHKHFILIAKFIPEDKMMIGPIYAYFQRFGPLRDVQRVQPDKAFILFERREAAQAAQNSVDAVMGNRYVKLFWARDQDFAEAGMTLSEDGTLQQTEQGSTTPQKSKAPRDGVDTRVSKVTAQQKREQAAAEREEQAKLAAEEKEKQVKAAEEDLKKKKEQIMALRREQDQRKADQQSKYDGLIAKQRKLMDEINASNDAQEKINLMGQWKVALAEAEGVLAELKPKAVTQAPPTTTRPARRNVSAFKVDNRPKNVLVSNARAEVTPELAVAVFRETERAERVQGGWLLCFSTRWAAESALRALGPLKRGFGPQAAAQIVTMTLPDSSPPVATAPTAASVVNPVEARPQTIAE